MVNILGTASSAGRQPGTPIIGTASAGNASATVTFTLPAYLGKPGDNNLYTATSTPGSITGSATGTSISVTGLSNGTSYTFKVAAKTRTAGLVDIATSATQSNASNAVTPVAPYYNPPVYYNPPPPPIYYNPPPAVCTPYGGFYFVVCGACGTGRCTYGCYGGPSYEFTGCTGT